MSSTDRRVVRTKASLHKGLVTLISGKRYSQIKVQDIVQQANLSRATFYLHYQDKDALFSECVEQLIEEMIACIQTWDIAQAALSEEPLRQIFQQVADNHVLYRVLLVEQGGVAIMPRLKNQLADGLMQWANAANEGAFVKQSRIPLDLVCGYTANALFGLLGWWLSNNMSYSTAYMAQVSRQLYLFGVMPVVLGGALPLVGPDETGRT